MKLKSSHPALIEGRPLHNKLRNPEANATPILKSVASNSKLGKGLGTITKGRWKGFPLFSLTLAERTTCPKDCLRWAECYGNSMPFAHRFEHGDALESRLRAEVAYLAHKYPKGFAIRLHILGDFYSKSYVMFWISLLQQYPNLHVYGYTARYGDDIASAIVYGRIKQPERFMIRFSRNEKYTNGSAMIYAAQEGKVSDAIQCPEQTGKAQSCLDCGLCWSVNKTITFIDHDKLTQQRKKSNEEVQSA